MNSEQEHNAVHEERKMSTKCLMVLLTVSFFGCAANAGEVESLRKENSALREKVFELKVEIEAHSRFIHEQQVVLSTLMAQQKTKADSIFPQGEPRHLGVVTKYLSEERMVVIKLAKGEEPFAGDAATIQWEDKIVTLVQMLGHSSAGYAVAELDPSVKLKIQNEFRVSWRGSRLKRGDSQQAPADGDKYPGQPKADKRNEIQPTVPYTMHLPEHLDTLTAGSVVDLKNSNLDAIVSMLADMRVSRRRLTLVVAPSELENKLVTIKSPVPLSVKQFLEWMAAEAGLTVLYREDYAMLAPDQRADSTLRVDWGMGARQVMATLDETCLREGFAQYSCTVEEVLNEVLRSKIERELVTKEERQSHSRLTVKIDEKVKNTKVTLECGPLRVSSLLRIVCAKVGAECHISKNGIRITVPKAKD